MSITVAIDTSTIVCAGLCVHGQATKISVGDQTSHAELLAEALASLMDEAGVGLSEIDEIVVGVGPGPFTGLRVGVATARTLAWLGGITIKGVCGLDVFALQYANSGQLEDEFIIATDARRKEVYWARYSPSGMRLDGPEVSAPALLPALPAGGPGARLYADRVPGGFIEECPEELDAAFMAAHARELPDVGIEPLYLRKPDAELPRTRKSTLTSGRLTLPMRGV